MINMPKVTIILTSYNHEVFLVESIDSILSQTFTDYELYIVDDCSTDNSWKVIQNYKDPRIHAIRRETNWMGGHIEDVVKHYALGEYIAVAHSDDRWEPQKLEKQLAFLEANQTTAACFTLVTVVDEKGQPILDKENFYITAFNQQNRSRYEWLRTSFYKGCRLCHPSLVIRRNAYKDYGLFTRGLHSIPDFCQWIRLFQHADVHILQEYLTCFRTRENGVNAGGDNAHNHYRGNTELYFVLREFEKITDPDAFVTIFPDAKEYLPDGKGMISYAYARILLDTTSFSQYRLYGLNLLYTLMQDDSTKQKLIDLYHYGAREFDRDKKGTDIFAAIPSTRFLDCRIYIDQGQGFQDDTCLRQPDVYINNDQEFVVTYIWDSSLASSPIRALRFDPDEAYPRKIMLKQVLVDGVPLHFEAVNAFSSQDGWDFFASSDPQYKLSVPTMPFKNIKIFGKAAFLPYYEANLLWNQRVDNLYKIMLEKQNDVRELQNTLKTKENDIGNLLEALALRERDVLEYKDALALRERDVLEYKDALALRERDNRELKDALSLRERDVIELKKAHAHTEAEMSVSRSALDVKQKIINDLQSFASKKESDIAELLSTLQLREQDIDELRYALVQKDKMVEELQEAIDEHQQHNIKKHEDHEQQRQEIMRLNVLLAKKEAELDAILKRKKRKIFG